MQEGDAMNRVSTFVVYRLLFGLVVLYGGLVSIAKGDIAARFLDPVFYFKYYGWEWLQAPSPAWIYAAYTMWIVGAAGIAVGLLYRVSVVVFFLGFTYLHFLDASNYINHYYLISILAVFLFFVPANIAWSLDARWGLAPRQPQLYRGILALFRLQIAFVYIGAGIAKLNSDWLFHAMPLRIWLWQKHDFPVLGAVFAQPWTAFAFSWFGAIYDLTIVGWLLWARTRPYAYAAVLAFHLLTGLLFDIGLFPPLMIASTLLFFPPSTFDRFFRQPPEVPLVRAALPLRVLAYSFVALQVFLPLRPYLLYKGDPVWTEEGYRFGWRVMLFEKEGLATFYVCDTASGREWMVDNSEYLTPFQQKQMSTKPEHIRQFAHFLAKVYQRRMGIARPFVRADVFVTHNGRPSRRLVRGDVDLAAEEASWWGYDWICRD